jgi:hypothetical protein
MYNLFSCLRFPYGSCEKSRNAGEEDKGAPDWGMSTIDGRNPIIIFAGTG